MKTVYIMSGVSGSGKSTVARELASAHVYALIVSADFFFGKSTEEYKKNFSPRLLGDAHNACKHDFLKELSLLSTANENLFPELSTSALVVDNTNTTALEMAFYIEAALAYGCKVIVVRVLADVETCISRNTHGVPEHAIKAMHERFEKNTPDSWPYHWQELEVQTIDNRASK